MVKRSLHTQSALFFFFFFFRIRSEKMDVSGWWKLLWVALGGGALVTFESTFFQGLALTGKVRTPAVTAHTPGAALLQIEVHARTLSLLHHCQKRNVFDACDTLAEEELVDMVLSTGDAPQHRGPAARAVCAGKPHDASDPESAPVPVSWRGEDGIDGRDQSRCGCVFEYVCVPECEAVLGVAAGHGVRRFQDARWRYTHRPVCINLPC